MKTVYLVTYDRIKDKLKRKKLFVIPGQVPYWEMCVEIYPEDLRNQGGE
jgi:hypothetical protein